jgi:hypothetical protein
LRELYIINPTRYDGGINGEEPGQIYCVLFCGAKQRTHKALCPQIRSCRHHVTVANIRNEDKWTGNKKKKRFQNDDTLRKSWKTVDTTTVSSDVILVSEEEASASSIDQGAIRAATFMANQAHIALLQRGLPLSPANVLDLHISLLLQQLIN